MSKNTIDLHMHTSMSDGSDSPLSMLDKIINAGIATFSFTDHDDLRSNLIILDELNKNSAKYKDITFYTGIEFSSIYFGRGIHLLAYGFDPNHVLMVNLVSKGVANRKTRIKKLFTHLETKHNIKLPLVDKVKILSLDTPGKVHIANAIINNNLVPNYTFDQVFQSFLKDFKAPEFKIAANEIIKIVKSVGGVVSLAHPIEIQKNHNLDLNELSDFLLELKRFGLGAIEAYHSSHTGAHIQDYLALAQKHKLLVSGGSDYHGSNKESAMLGKLNSDSYQVEASEFTMLDAIFPNYGYRAKSCKHFKGICINEKT